jgi:hypothetical protein
LANKEQIKREIIYTYLNMNVYSERQDLYTLLATIKRRLRIVCLLIGLYIPLNSASRSAEPDYILIQQTQQLHPGHVISTQYSQL